MIEPSAFHKLRLRYLIPHRKTDRAWFTSYLGHYWFGQTYYFTDVLQPVSSPSATHSLSVEFDRLSDEEVADIFHTLGLPVEKSLGYDDMVTLFGQPSRVEEYLNDRKTFEYKMGKTQDYIVHFTLLNDGPIAFFNMHTARFNPD